MKFGIYKNSTLRPLDRLAKLVSNRSSLPILDCVKVELKGDSICLTAGNDSTKMSISTEAMPLDNEFGGFCVDIKTFQDVLKKMPEVGISITHEGNEIEIDFNSGKIKLPVFPLEEYPSLEEMDGEGIFIDSKLSENISKAFMLSADDELRPVLNGVYFDTTGGNIVGTDGHSMYVSSGLPTSNSISPFIMSKDANKAIKGLKEYSVKADSRNVFINGDDFVVISRLIEGNFPNYKSVIPDNRLKYIVDRETMLRSIDRSTICANESTSLVVLEMSSSSISISTEDLNNNLSFKEEMPCNGEESGRVGLKGTLAALCLKLLDTEMIYFTFTSESRAILFKPMGGGDDLKELILLMPIVI